MPRTQKNFDYPEVHPPHPQTQYPAESHQPTPHANNRYSWVEASVEEPNTHSAQTPRAAKRQSTAPPLPLVPEHLNQGYPTQRQGESEQSQPQRQWPQQHQQPAVQQQMSKQQEAGIHHESNQLSQHNLHAFTQQQEEQLPPSPPRRDEVPQKPDPVKRTPDHPNYSSAIMPDENPLSPSSPLDRKSTPRPQTTNMPLGQPTRSTYNFSSYAPVPQVTTGGSWTHSLCSCSEPTICFTGLFCPCILYGRTQHRLHLRSDKKDPTNMLGYSAVNGSCMTWAFLCGINGILSGVQRTRVRRAYEMESGSGNVFSDCCQGCCCCCCVLAQNEKEVKVREESARRPAGQDGYVPPMSMMFAQPPR